MIKTINKILVFKTRQCGDYMNKENNKLPVSDIFVQYCKTKIKEQYLTYYEIAKRSQYYPSTMGFYFVESNNNKKMSYSTAVVLLEVLHGRRFVSADERIQFQKILNISFILLFVRHLMHLTKLICRLRKIWYFSFNCILLLSS